MASKKKSNRKGTKRNKKKSQVKEIKETKSVKKEHKKKRKSVRKNGGRAKGNNLLKEVNPEQYFLVCDGQVLKNIFDLVDALDCMSEDVFCYHVNDERNDIFNWLKDVFKEEELAERIVGIRSPLRLEIALLREIIARVA
jgi:hypothetical protein